MKLVEVVLETGIPQNSLGLISPYRSQVGKFKNLFTNYPAIEVSTVDRYQGRDKDCIMVSLVRSNKERKVPYYLLTSKAGAIAARLAAH